MKFRLTLFACLLMLCGVKAYSQSGNPPTIQIVPTAAGLKAAEEMLIASGADTQFQKNIKAIIDQYSAQIPEANRAKFVTVMNQFLEKYISWDILKHDIVMMYAREFTEPELKQLAAFYKTPLGTKLNQKQPALMQAGMAIGQQSVMAHQDELKQMMMDALK